MVIGMGRAVRNHSTWRIVRAGGEALEVGDVVVRARAFGAAVALIGPTTLLTMRDEHGLSSYVTLGDHPNSEDVAAHLANAVGGRHERLPDDEHGNSSPPDLTNVSCVSVLLQQHGGGAGRESQNGANPNAVAELLARSMRPGSWIAVTTRRASKAEKRRVRAWYKHRLGGATTHHSNESEVLVFSMMAGGADANEVEILLSGVAATMPGFDIDTRTRTVGSTIAPVLAASGLSAAILAGAGVGLHHWPLGGLLATIPALAAAGIGLGILPSGAKRMEAQLDSGRLKPARARTLRPKPPRKEGTNAKTGKLVKEHGGDYPLVDSAFFGAPSVFVGVVSPHTGTASGAAVTTMRDASKDLLQDIGPIVGTAGSSQQAVHISAADRSAGIGLLGVPGSGKSLAVRHLFAWNSLERVRPSTRPGRPGKRNVLVAFESKGDGAMEYVKWSTAIGDPTLLIEVANPLTPAIDIFDVPGTAVERASFFINAMTYAFGESAIGDRSYETLNEVMSMALLLTPEIVDAAELTFAVTHSPISYAHLLLGGSGDEAGKAVVAALISHAQLESLEGTSLQAEMSDAYRRVQPLYGPLVTNAQRRTLCEAPRNKVSQLMEAETWWAADRAKVGWSRVLESDWSLIINTGVTATGELVGDKLSETMSRLLMYSLREAIMRTCNGWQDQGRSITIFADELSLLAGSSSEVITWMRNQGRSYGVCPIFATQNPDQLDQQVRKALMSFGTVFWFAQTDAQTIRDGAEDLSIDGGNWSAADLANLEPYHAIMRATVGKRRQPAVPVQMSNWSDSPGHMLRFAADQGYADVSPPSIDGW